MTGEIESISFLDEAPAMSGNAWAFSVSTRPFLPADRLKKRHDEARRGGVPFECRCGAKPAVVEAGAGPDFRARPVAEVWFLKIINL